MNDNMISLRFELDVQAQKMISQLMLNNEVIEKQIKTGIEKAIAELSENNNLAEMISNKVKEQIVNSISSYMYSYSIKDKVNDLIRERLNKHISDYTDNVLDQTLAHLTSLDLGVVFGNKKQ